MDTHKIYEVVEKFKKDNEVPGIAVGVILEQETYTTCLGSTNKENDDTGITEDTLFEVGSISKIITAEITSKILLENNLKKESPLGKIFSEDIQMKSVTWNDLINHTSGLPRLPDNLKPKNILNPYQDYSKKELYDFLKDFQNLNTDSEYEYSNLGYAVLGEALSCITKKDFFELLNNVVLQPCGIVLHRNTESGMSFGYLEDNTKTCPWDQDVFYPAGGVIMSLRELLVYLKHRMQANETIGCVISNDFYWHNGRTGGFASFVGFDKSRKFGISILSNKSISVDSLANEIIKIIKNNL